MDGRSETRVRAGRRLGAALAAALVALAAAPAAALPESTWVVAIGNNHGEAGDEPLRYAERDAREIAEVLRAEGGVASERVRLLIDEKAEAVRRTILEVNGALRAQLGDGRTPSALIVFYSGHADAEALHLGGSRFGIAELRGLLEGSAASLRLLVVDACRSGALTRVKGLRPAQEFELSLDDHVEGEGIAIISSSAAGESSQEADRLRASFFSHHLVSGLRGAADRDGDGRVTLTEAYAYAYAQTVRSSGQTLALQHPTYSYDVKGRRDVVLTTPGASGRRRGRLRLARAVTYVIAEDKEGGPIAAEVTPARDRAALVLPEGRYFVQAREPDQLREYTLRLVADGETDLAAQPSRLVRYDRLVRKGGGARSSVHGLVLLGGARGGVLDGEGVMPGGTLGYTADLPWLSAGLRVRVASAPLTSVDGGLDSRHDEVGLVALLQRTIDLPWLSVGFGVTVEGVYHAQRFLSPARPAPARQGLGAGFGALLAVERHLAAGLALRIEGGPVALLHRASAGSDGAADGGLRPTLTGWAAGGLVWRL